MARALSVASRSGAKNSTIVRSLAAGGLVRRALCLAAPGVAARLAERAVLTPPRSPLDPRDAERLAAGHRFTVRWDGGRLAAWSWGDGPTVFLVHGWGSRAGRMTAFVPPLLEAGFSVVAFDGPGHGESDGERSSMVEMAGALRAVAEWAAAAESAAGHAGVVAHSLGGPVAAFAMRRGLRIRRAVFIGAPADLDERTAEFALAQGLTPGVLRRLRERVERRVGVSWREIRMAALAPAGETPLLLVHDREDREVPWRDAAAIAASWPGAELLATTGLGHRRVVGDPAVVAAAVEFLRRRAPAGQPPSPSRRRNASFPAANASQTESAPNT